MSKPDEKDNSARIVLKGKADFIKSVRADILDNVRSTEKISADVKSSGGNLYIDIKTKNTKLLQSVISTYLNAISTMEEIDEL